MLHIRLQDKLKEISDVLCSYKASGSIGLYDGDAGVVLFCALGYLATKEELYLNKAYQLLDALDDTDSMVTNSFCSGIAGYAWLLNYLVNTHLIEIDRECFCQIDNALRDGLRRAIDNNNYDQLHGAISIGRYFLSVDRLAECAIIIDNLYDARETDFEEVKWPTYNSFWKVWKYDFGLAHGMAGYLYFIVKCYLKGIRKDKCRTMIDGIFNLYDHNTQALQQTNSIYPASLPIEDYYPKDHRAKARLAWCYGDAGTLYSLYKSALLLKRKATADYFLSKLELIAHRIDPYDCGVEDAFFCHGTSFLAYAFKRLSIETQLECFSNASEHWAWLTLQFGSARGHLAGYRYIRYDGCSKDSIWLLEGITGIGIVLLSLIFNIDSAWDECMMLS